MNQPKDDGWFKAAVFFVLLLILYAAVVNTTQPETVYVNQPTLVPVQIPQAPTVGGSTIIGSSVVSSSIKHVLGNQSQPQTPNLAPTTNYPTVPSQYCGNQYGQYGPYEQNYYCNQGQPPYMNQTPPNMGSGVGYWIHQVGRWISGIFHVPSHAYSPHSSPPLTSTAPP